MRGRGPPQGWDQASGRASASPPGAPPAPRCLIRALAGVSLEPQDFLSCGGKVREVRGGSWGSQSLGRKRAGPGGGCGGGWRGCLGRREGRKEEVGCREMSVEGLGEVRRPSCLQNQEGSEWGGWGPPDLQRRCGVVSPCAALQWGEEQEAAASCVGAANVCQGR